MSIGQERVRRESVQAPADAGELDAREDVFDEESERQELRKGRRGLKIAIGVGVATVVAAAAGFAGVRAMGGNEASPSLKGSDKETSAPLNPAQTAEATPTPAATETAPATAETDSSKWNPENVPLTADLDQDGKSETYVGVEAFREAQAIKVADHPDWQSAGKALLDRTNAYINFGTNKSGFESYYSSSYQTADGQRLGAGAVMWDFVDPTTKEALLGSPEKGEQVTAANPEEWFETQSQLEAQTMNRSYRSQDKGGAAYRFAYSPDKSKGENQMVLQHQNEETGTSVFTMFLKFDDNAEKATLDSDETSVEGGQAWHVAMQQQDGEWKVIGIQTDSYEG